MKNAVVTGAGSGIGKEIVYRLIDRNMRVFAIGRRFGPLEELARACANRGEVVPLSADVRDAESLRASLHTLTSLCVLVANAGVCFQSPLDDPHADEVFKEVMGINVDGVWNTFRVLSQRMEKNGRCVVISSGLGKLGRGGYGAYTASKHAVLGLVKCFSKELARNQITVNAVCPGWVDTQMSANDLVFTAQKLGTEVEQVRKEALANIPLGRFVKAAEVASLVDWLTSDQASAVTGQAYNISCGEFFA